MHVLLSGAYGLHVNSSGLLVLIVIGTWLSQQAIVGFKLSSGKFEIYHACPVKFEDNLTGVNPACPVGIYVVLGLILSNKKNG